MLSRRTLLSAAASVPFAGCLHPDEASYAGGWVGASHERGHRLREGKSGRLPAPAVQRRAGVLVVGAGIAGLACARALTRSGIDDVQVFELEDSAGGNSRGHRIAGMACPLGAHYLPLPGEQATEVIELLDEFGLRRMVHGRAAYDERHLCHSPQERLFIAGHWHEGLLPPIDALPSGQRAATLAQYQRFAGVVARLGRGNAFTIPTARAHWRPGLDALDATAFGPWLDAQGFDAPALRWYLDYCCRDDYGAGAHEVSAWAGLHYFASRHGFHAPGGERDERDGLLTWPEGNAWVSSRLAAPLQQRLHSGQVALRVAEGRHAVDVDVWNVHAQQVERWTAPRLVLATPLFVSARLLESPSSALTDAAARLRYAPWRVANLHLDAALDDHPGAPPSWDNVIYGSASLGYVDAMHQSMRPHPGPTVLTAYASWGANPADREALLTQTWSRGASRVVEELATVHPDLPAKVRQVDLMRYGHAMSIPVPGVRSSAALRALAEQHGRVVFAHSDLSAYSVFEEALFHGVRAARACCAPSPTDLKKNVVAHGAPSGVSA
jgi:predicted NAD/FAD-dependent oxidoreductase